MLRLILNIFILLFCSVKYWGELIICLGYISFIFILISINISEFCVQELFIWDNFGYSLSLLRVWIIVLALIRSINVKFSENYQKLYASLIVLLLIFLFFCFSFTDYLLFYLSFEASLIPILIIILGWGYQPERAQAGIYILFYTFFASLPLFFYLLLLKGIFGRGWIFIWISSCWRGLLDFVLIIAFLVKFPIYIVHLWLPKAHVEAPVAGSIILAGVLLKLGGYGLIRLLVLLNEKPFWGNIFIIVLAIWGGFLTRLICLRQVDMKLLIAYSSVVHISLCIGALMLSDRWGNIGLIRVIIGHGLCSSGLFSLSNMVYERTHSRSVWVSKGLLNLIPLISLWWFLIISGNIAAPPRLNLLGEIGIIIRLINKEISMIFVISLLSFFRAVYSLYLFSFTQHGIYLYTNCGVQRGIVIDFLILILHWFPLNGCVLLIFCLFYLVSLIENIILWL